MKLHLIISAVALGGLAMACGDDGTGGDAAVDSGPGDTGAGDSSAGDSSPGDTGTADTGATDASPMDGATDSAAGDGGGTDGAADGSTSCSTDSDCAMGAQWCVGGECVDCDNSGLLCDIACAFGWEPYERNGCFPCACGPTTQCTRDADCLGGGECYAGAFCWDYCPAGDPSCCLGNRCEGAGCADPMPQGCITRGCPMGVECQDFATSGVCMPSSCSCAGGSWVCTDDCGGGSCAAP